MACAIAARLRFFHEPPVQLQIRHHRLRWNSRRNNSSQDSLPYAQTERPITINQGTNQLVEPDTLESHLETLLSENERICRKIDLWDGNAAQRAVHIIKDLLN